MVIMLCFVGSITFDILGTLNSAGEGCMTPFLAVLALRYARVHVCILYCCYETAYIKVFINWSFHFVTALDIQNIDLNNVHVRFKENLDNLRF